MQHLLLQHHQNYCVDVSFGLHLAREIKRHRPWMCICIECGVSMNGYSLSFGLVAINGCATAKFTKFVRQSLRLKESLVNISRKWCELNETTLRGHLFGAGAGANAAHIHKNRKRQRNPMLNEVPCAAKIPHPQWLWDAWAKQCIAQGSFETISNRQRRHLQMVQVLAVNFRFLPLIKINIS